MPALPPVKVRAARGRPTRARSSVGNGDRGSPRARLLRHLHMQQHLARVLFEATTPPPAKLPGPARRPSPAFGGGRPGQGNREGHRRRRADAQLPHPARRPHDHRRQPHPACRRATRGSPWSPRPPGSTPGIRATWRLPPPRVRRVSRNQITTHFRRQASWRASTTISCPGRRPTAPPSYSAATSGSCSPPAGTLRPWSTRHPTRRRPSGSRPATRPITANGWPKPRRCRAADA